MVQEAAAVATLQLGAAVTQLKQVNDRMHELQEGRVSEIENKDLGAFASARSAAEEAYRMFVLSVNSWAMLNPGKYDEGASEDGSTLSPAQFIAWANANIKYYNYKVLGITGGSAGSGDSDGDSDVDVDIDGDGDGGETTNPGGSTGGSTEGGEETTTPTLYTATFVANGATVATQQYEAGAVIQAPTAPSGYEWEDYPYRMPAEDITVNAVRRNIPGGGGGSGFE